MKLSEAFDMYISDYMVIKNRSESAIDRCKYVKDEIVRFLGDKNIENLNFDDIKNWYDHLSHGRCANTKRQYIINIRMVLRYIRLRGVKCMNYELIPVPKVEATVPTFLTSQEVSRLIDCSYDTRVAFLISLLYSSGIRLSEMLQLKRNQIVDRQFTVIGKGRKPRLCFIDERTEDLMNKYLATRTDNSDYLIVTKLYSKRMSKSDVQLIVRDTAKRAGLPKRVTPHTLRHSFATNFLKNNGNMRYLSTLMGHASLDTTAMYAHVVDNDLKEQYLKYHTT